MTRPRMHAPGDESRDVKARAAAVTAHAELDDVFFAGGDDAVRRAFPERVTSILPVELVEPAPRRRRGSAAARARRRTLLRWFTGTVALSGVVCAAAALRVALPGGLFEEPATALAELPRPVPVDAPAAQERALAVALPLPRDLPPPPVVSATDDEPSPSAEAQPAPASSAKVPAPSAPSPAIALRARAKRALEQGRVADALSDARRAATLAPASADSWLLLGAAYLEAGDRNAAQDSFRTCVAVASSGPVRECKALARP